MEGTSLTFNAMTTSQCVIVEIVNDTVVESLETLTVSLSSSDTAVDLSNATTVVHIITDNDGKLCVNWTP